MIKKKIIILTVIVIFLIVGTIIFQYLKTKTNDKVVTPNTNILINESFECGNSVTFNYKGDTVSYGTVENPGTGKCWMDRNLGALKVATAFDDSEAYGDLFQWGRLDDGHQERDSETTMNLSDNDKPGHNKFITSSDWRSNSNDELWQGENGINNPCPVGWRVPTASEWEEEIKTWSSKNREGAYNSLLKLTSGGLRYNKSADIVWEGKFGYYWSSTIKKNHTSSFLTFVSDEAHMSSNLRSFGLSVRCIKTEVVGEAINKDKESEIFNQVLSSFRVLE